jgi:hypothetical protein
MGLSLNGTAMTPLQIKVMSQHNGPMLTLCDGTGAPLPNQEKVELFNSVLDVPKVTVTFVIDGTNVKLMGGNGAG